MHGGQPRRRASLGRGDRGRAPENCCPLPGPRTCVVGPSHSPSVLTLKEASYGQRAELGPAPAVGWGAAASQRSRAQPAVREVGGGSVSRGAVGTQSGGQWLDCAEPQSVDRLWDRGQGLGEGPPLETAPECPALRRAPRVEAALRPGRAQLLLSKWWRWDLARQRGGTGHSGHLPFRKPCRPRAVLE